MMCKKYSRHCSLSPSPSLSRFLFLASKLSHSTFHYWVLIVKEDKQDIPSTVVWMHKQHRIHAIQHTQSGAYTDKHRLRLKGASAKFRLAADEGEGQTRLISKVNESSTVRGETQAIKKSRLRVILMQRKEGKKQNISSWLRYILRMKCVHWMFAC